MDDEKNINNGMVTEISSVSGSERFQTLDFVRGIAVLGILVMNIQAFGNVFASYFNPTINGDFSGINQVAWYTTHIFFEQKFYTIFSMLFGAGIVVMAQRATDKGHSSAKIHYRRTSLLLMFGLIHAFLIWFGDILVSYAFWGFWVFLLWKKSPKVLLWTGMSLVLLISLIMLLGALFMPPEEVDKLQETFAPSQESINVIIEAYRGSWGQQLSQRIDTALILLSQMVFFGFRLAGCMLIGMGLYKLGILNGLKSVTFYKKLTLFTLIPGLILAAYGAKQLVESGFTDAVQAQMVLGHYNYLGSLLVALGYIGLFHWLYLSCRIENIKHRLEAVGRMAFTNYISQSIICTGIFYGFGLFSKLERAELLGVALLVLCVQIIWSKWWLDRFYFGPLEWLWRSLTYAKLQPFKIAK